MRLLNTKHLYFEEFFDSKIPKYAILSHRWEEDEVSLQDFLCGKRKNGAGYLKITNCCIMAAKRGFDWVWIDTCCIDKKSSAELSETLNSMFRMYGRASECYAYLSDVRWVHGEPPEKYRSSFRKSVWFGRGWTLQELLAPRNVLFLSREWCMIGTKDSLSEEISSITGIGAEYLDSIEEASVAMKMSWASKLETSR